ncbi:RIP metalloprotease RseP [Thorsellia anophelis]|uniref:Zinc metalloprotease n=1 Tax=Thorsellia anophelis DSM 18579 TaxID=1123402 RepID=A0A1H9YQR8_9GAMM|nr:RIP metalloprotease RseP [Thorsellia anophelis]SES71505.1 regulator of sigma E protease [Thorsellia anophelis DSM 18579]
MFNLLLFLVTIGILVVIHEYGHFIVARKCGVRVEKFSIGFGPKLYSWYDKNGTEFSLSMIPLGGYVRMLDERVAEVNHTLKDKAFNNKTIAQRAMIIAAGPLANFILAFFIFWLLAMIGFESRKSVILSVEPMSIASQANIPANTVIMEINGQDARSLITAEAILHKLAENKTSSATLILQDMDDETYEFERVLSLSDWQFDPQNQVALTSLGIVFPEYPLNIQEVLSDSPAQKAGLQPGDIITHMNAEPVNSRQEFIHFINYHANETVYLTLMRNSTEIDVMITPEKIVDKQGDKEISKGRIGISFANDPLKDEYMLNNRYNPLTSLWIASKMLTQKVGLILGFLVDAVKGNASIDDIAGPVGIAQAAGSQFSFGMSAYLAFLAFLSINLGIMNLLPIPVLDGGHLLFLAVEKIKGSPVSLKIQQNFYFVGAILLILLMGLTFISDFMRF